ncbi:hypothetical protein J2X34_003159 [Rhodococcus sp. BE178]
MIAVVEGLELGWRQVAAVLVESTVVEPVDPFESGDFDLVNGPPKAPRRDQLGLVEAVDRLREGIVVAVPGGPDRGVDAGLDEPLGERNRRVLGEFNRSERTTVRLSGLRRAMALRRADTARSEVMRASIEVADDLVGVAILDRTQVELAFSGAMLGNVVQPQHIRLRRSEVAGDRVVVHRRPRPAASAGFLGERGPDPLQGAQPMDAVLAGGDVVMGQLVRDEPVPERRIVGLDIEGCVDQMGVVPVRCETGSARRL